jgi:hypothetical protein
LKKRNAFKHNSTEARWFVEESLTESKVMMNGKHLNLHLVGIRKKPSFEFLLGISEINYIYPFVRPKIVYENLRDFAENKLNSFGILPVEAFQLAALCKQVGSKVEVACRDMLVVHFNLNLDITKTTSIFPRGLVTHSRLTNSPFLLSDSLY